MIQFKVFKEFKAFKLFISLILLTVIMPRTVYARVKDIDASAIRIVALVNGEAISSIELERRVNALKQQMAQTDGTVSDEKELKKAVLERLIYETLMFQAAKKQKLIPNESLIQQAINDAVVQSNTDMSEFIKKLGDAGTSIEQYKLDVKHDMTLSAVREYALQSRIKITDREIETFLKDPESGIKMEYGLWVLSLPKSETITAQGLSDLKRQADTLYQKALALKPKKNSTDIQGLLKAFSALQPVLPKENQHVVEQSAKPLSKLPELFSRAVETMNVGDISPVLESSAGFYIIRLNHKQTALPQVKQTLARHILLAVSDKDTDKQVRKNIASLHNQLVLNNNQFESLAKTHSQDASAIKGGDLGWVFQGDLVPEFEAVMDVLKPGEISLPLRTQFGWHIVQVLDRKTTELPLSRLRQQARNIIGTQKQKQAMTEWLEELKTNAYIEYR